MYRHWRDVYEADDIANLTEKTLIERLNRRALEQTQRLNDAHQNDYEPPVLILR